MRDAAALAEKLRALAVRITPDHHSQAGLLLMMLILAAVLRSRVMLLAWSGYLLMHICFGGRGGYQTPLRADRPAAFLDIVIVLAGIVCMVAYVSVPLLRAVNLTSRVVQRLVGPYY